jgi:hypothetical protein
LLDRHTAAADHLPPSLSHHQPRHALQLVPPRQQSSSSNSPCWSLCWRSARLGLLALQPFGHIQAQPHCTRWGELSRSARRAISTEYQPGTCLRYPASRGGRSKR